MNALVMRIAWLPALPVIVEQRPASSVTVRDCMAPPARRSDQRPRALFALAASMLRAPLLAYLAVSDEIACDHPAGKLQQVAVV